MEGGTEAGILEGLILVKPVYKKNITTIKTAPKIALYLKTGLWEIGLMFLILFIILIYSGNGSKQSLVGPHLATS